MNKKPMDELVDDIKEGFSLVECIKRITECNSILALQSLRKQINKRIKELKKEK